MEGYIHRGNRKDVHMKIMISPFSRPLRNGKKNAKDYPHWEEVVRKLKEHGDYIVQVVWGDEKEIPGMDEHMRGMTLRELEKNIHHFDTWISIDNYFHHMAAIQEKPGVVIFSRSDPKIYGHDININLLKNRAFLRPDQYNIWEQCEYNEDAFVSPDEVVKAVNMYFRHE